MPLNVNGYNETFKAFAEFAAKSVDAGDAKAIARTDAQQAGSMAGRSITASMTDSVRHMFKWSRTDDDKAENNAARNLFKATLVGIASAENNVLERAVPVVEKRLYVLAQLRNIVAEP